MTSWLIWLMVLFGWSETETSLPALELSAQPALAPLVVPDPETSERYSGHLFDGVDDQIAIANSASLNFERTDAFSVTFWIYLTGSSGFVASKIMHVGPYTGWGIVVNGYSGTAPGQVEFELVNDFATSNMLMVRGATDIRSAWHHVAVTYDGSSSASGVKMYIDGAAEPTTTLVDGLTASIRTGENALLGSRGGGGLFLAGRLTQVRIYPVALSQSMVSGDRFGGTPVRPARLWYRARPGSGQFITDESGNGHDGTLGSTSAVEAGDPAWAGPWKRITDGGPE